MTSNQQRVEEIRKTYKMEPNVLFLLTQLDEAQQRNGRLEALVRDCFGHPSGQAPWIRLGHTGYRDLVDRAAQELKTKLSYNQ